MSRFGSQATPSVRERPGAQSSSGSVLLSVTFTVAFTVTLVFLPTLALLTPVVEDEEVLLERSGLMGNRPKGRDTRAAPPAFGDGAGYRIADEMRDFEVVDRLAEHTGVIMIALPFQE